MRWKVRKPKKKLNVRMRHRALSSNEQVRLKLVQKAIIAVSLTKRDDKKYVLTRLSSLYLSILLEDIDELDRDELVETRQNYRRTLASFGASDLHIATKFTRNQCIQLIDLLRFPQRCVLSNRIAMSGEEVFLRGLYELSTGMNQELIASCVFGREGSSQCRAFSYFINHIYDNFHHLVHDNLAWYFRNGLAKQSAVAIGARSDIPDNLVAFFIDCNCLQTSVCGGGPSEDGANAARWDEAISRAFYNGWKSVNGLKHQTINDAFGICVDMCGPTSLRRNDLTVLRMSNINQRLRDIQMGEAEQNIIMGDSAYKKQSHITSYHQAAEMIPGFQEWNRKMKKVRISIEWDYGHTASLFRYLQNIVKLKLLRRHTVTRIYTVCTILRNVHTGFNGSQTSQYFNVMLPDDYVQKYLTQTDF